MPENILPQATNAATNGVAGISFKQEILRKAVHLSSLWMVAAICLLPRWPLAIAFAVAFVLNILVELAYSYQLPVITPLYKIFFGKMLRKEVKPGQLVVSGGPYVWAAAALVTSIYPRPAAAGALAVMLLGDTAAALIGRRFGRHKTVNGKSVEGVIAFIIAGMLGVLAVNLCLNDGVLSTAYLMWAIPGVVVAAAAELFEKQLHLDDNFSIPLIAGFFLWLSL
ncbi:MAG: SEC59/DGK1/VTE5 family protein [Lentisphaeria bacterium]|nr:SEC59/DGK1/VTE5 family protein [Lentisphaeria bacterium]